MKYFKPYTADASHIHPTKLYNLDETLIIISNDIYSIRRLKNFLEKNEKKPDSTVDFLSSHVLH